jgi:fructose-1,6-bisphosphatase II
MQCKIWPRTEEEEARFRAEGVDLERVLSLPDLVRGENVFFAATGVTDGELLKGVHYRGATIETQSIVMRSKSGTIRSIDAIHQMRKLEQISSLPYSPLGA